MSRDAFIYKLKLLGWTQEEIGEVVGITHQAVSEIASKLNQFKPLAKSDFYEKHKSAEEIADHPDVTVNQTQISRIMQNVDTDKMHNRARVSQIVNKIDTDKINNLFYEAHKEVDNSPDQSLACHPVPKPGDH